MRNSLLSHVNKSTLTVNNYFVAVLFKKMGRGLFPSFFNGWRVGFLDFVEPCFYGRIVNEESVRI